MMFLNNNNIAIAKTVQCFMLVSESLILLIRDTNCMSKLISHVIILVYKLQV